MTDEEIVEEEVDELKLYSTQQIAELFEVTPQTVRNWIAEKELPAVRFGKQLRVKRNDLVDFVNSRYGRSEVFGE